MKSKRNRPTAPTVREWLAQGLLAQDRRPDCMTIAFDRGHFFRHILRNA
jgi:hypothetical protein